MPTILIIAGPNGAGKTTFANAWFEERAETAIFLNADEIGRRELSHLTGGARDVAAGRILLERLEILLAAREAFVLETTLSSLIYARRIPAWRAAGYRVDLAYIRIPDVRTSQQRVAARAAGGGHNVTDADLLRRFDRSVRNLDAYKRLVDSWAIWENAEKGHILIEWSEN